MFFRVLVLVLAVLAAPVGAEERIVVFAAASLKTALDRVAEGWTAAGGVPLALSYAGSSALARQIQQGAPADVFISASVEWMDVVEADGLLQDNTRRDLAGNTLVLVRHGAGDRPVDISEDFDLVGELDGRRLAMALVDAVPAGIYGREALQSLALWESVADQVAQTDNVRSALALVATGEAPLGIVYATDARAEPRVSVAGEFPAASHSPIRYPAAAVLAGAHPGAVAFLDYLAGAEAGSVFRDEGFLEVAQ